MLNRTSCHFLYTSLQDTCSSQYMQLWLALAGTLRGVLALSSCCPTQAKRLLKEMQAVAAAAEASRNLEAVMGRRPSGPVQLKLALNKAEAAASHLSSLGGNPPCTGLTEVLGPLMAAARRRLDSERAAEALTKAAASYRTLADLARLEAAIYNAKKVRMGCAVARQCTDTVMRGLVPGYLAANMFGRAQVFLVANSRPFRG